MRDTHAPAVRVLLADRLDRHEAAGRHADGEAQLRNPGTDSGRRIRGGHEHAAPGRDHRAAAGRPGGGRARPTRATAWRMITSTRLCGGRRRGWRHPTPEGMQAHDGASVPAGEGISLPKEMRVAGRSPARCREGGPRTDDRPRTGNDSTEHGHGSMGVCGDRSSALPRGCCLGQGQRRLPETWTSKSDTTGRPEGELARAGQRRVLWRRRHRPYLDGAP